MIVHLSMPSGGLGLSMAVDDLWLSKRKDPQTGERVRTERYGRGKRWRVRWADPDTGRVRSEAFDKKTDAERHDANTRASIGAGTYVDPAAGRVTLRAHGEAWRAQQLHRGSTAQRVKRSLDLHVYPVLGQLQLAAVRPSHLRGWVKDRRAVLAPSTLRGIYAGVLTPMFRAAVNDRLIGTSPCVGVKLPEIDAAEYLIATPDQVRALYEALPERYRALVYLCAGCGLRASEALGLEVGHVAFLQREVHVRQQLQSGIVGRKPFLTLPKTQKSRRTVELPDVVSEALALHMQQTPPRPVDVEDETDERHPKTRAAQLLFTNAQGRPINRASWSHVWQPAREAVGLPPGYGLRDLRHFFATALIYGGASVKHVQLQMGHAAPTITLDVYTGYWPDSVDTTRNLLNAAFQTAETAAQDAP